MFARGYFPGRSGQVFYVPHEGDFLVDKDPLYKFMHGSPWSYDTSIPLFFHGPGFIRTGAFAEPAVQQDIVPTLARLLNIAPPATTTGRVLSAALETTTTRPRVIALFVLDGTRRDYFDTHAAAIPTLSRLRREGAWFSGARTTSMPTATSRVTRRSEQAPTRESMAWSSTVSSTASQVPRRSRTTTSIPVS